MILSGKKSAVIQHVQLIEIHSTRYIDLVYTHAEESDRPQRARLGPEAVYADPQPGDQVRVSYIMGVATGVERQETSHDHSFDS